MTAIDVQTEHFERARPTPSWKAFPTYTKAERYADAKLHIFALTLALAATPVMLSRAVEVDKPYAVAASMVYLISLLSMLSASAAYNMTGPSRLKDRLRRFDHSAIFVKIAGGYTPLCILVIGGSHGLILLSAVWTVGAVGVWLKMRAPQKMEALSVPIYVALGWAILFCARVLFDTASADQLTLLAAGGVAYSVGVIFHLWESLPYQNVIWHLFVFTGSGFIFAANFTALG